MFTSREQIVLNRRIAFRRRQVFVDEMYNDRCFMLELRLRKIERDMRAELAIVSRAYMQAQNALYDINNADISRRYINDTDGHWAFSSANEDDPQFQSVNCTHCGNYLSWTSVHLPSSIICRCSPPQEENITQAA
jgi:hypothetical protein